MRYIVEYTTLTGRRIPVAHKVFEDAASARAFGREGVKQGNYKDYTVVNVADRTNIDESKSDKKMTAAHKKLARDVHKQLNRDEPMAQAAGMKLKANHKMLKSEYGKDWRKLAGINEEAEIELEKGYTIHTDRPQDFVGTKTASGDYVGGAEGEDRYIVDQAMKKIEYNDPTDSNINQIIDRVCDELNCSPRQKRMIAKIWQKIGYDVRIDEVSTEKLRSYASAALQDKNPKKAGKRWKYASKAMDTVADRDVDAAHARKYNKTESVELDEGTTEADWKKDSAAVKKSKDPKFISKMIDKWGQRGGAWLNHPALKEAVEQDTVNEISDELKKRYHEKGREDVYNRFTGSGKYEKPRDPAHYTPTGRVKKGVRDRPEAVKYREKIASRNKYLAKVKDQLSVNEAETELDEIKGVFKNLKKHAANLGDKFVQGALHGATFGQLGHDTWDPLTGDTYDKVKPFSNRLKKNKKTKEESAITEGDIVNFSMYAGMYSDGAHASFFDRNGNAHTISATGDRPRKYYIDGKEVSWEDAKRIVGNQKLQPRQGMAKSVNEANLEEAYIKTSKDAIDTLGALRKIGKHIETGDNTYDGNLANMYANDVYDVISWVENNLDTNDPKYKQILAPVIELRKKAKGMERELGSGKDARFGNQIVNTLYPLMQWIEMNSTNNANEGINEDISQEAHHMERDHEVQMARSDLYKTANYAVKLHSILKGISEEQGLEGWMQAKITKAADYLGSVFHALEYDQMERRQGNLTMPVGEAKVNEARRSTYQAMRSSQSKDRALKAQKDTREKLKKYNNDKKKEEVDETTTAGAIATSPMPMGEAKVNEGIENLSNARLKFHATKGVPHGRYSRKEIKDEHNRRKKSEPNYHTVKPSMNETTSAGGVAAVVAQPLGKTVKRKATK